MKSLSLFLLACCALLSGCLSRPMESVPYTHTESKAQAFRIVNAWILEDPANRSMGIVACTGSMKPLLYGGEYILLVRYQPSMPVKAGQIVVFDRGDCSTVMHRVICSSDRGSFLTMGDNCSRPDGFYSKDRISFVCAGIVAFPQ